MKLDTHFFLCHSQIPNQITVPNDYHHTQLIPLEIAGWWLRKENVKQCDWILVVGPDPTAMLAVHVVGRLGIPVNVVAGISKLTGSEVSRIIVDKCHAMSVVVMTALVHCIV